MSKPMTRRFQDISRPRGRGTIETAISAGLATLAGAIVLGLLILVAEAFLAGKVRARDLGQWAGGPVSAWYRSLMQPDQPTVSCCGEADAYWADKVETGPGGELVAVVTDDRDDVPLGRHHVPIGTRIVVPPHKIKWDRGNPTGHIVIFLSVRNDVYCYVQNGGV